MPNNNPCPICNTISKWFVSNADSEIIKCSRCGRYEISRTALSEIISASKLDQPQINHYCKEQNDNKLINLVAKKAENKGINEPFSIISHAIRKSNQNGRYIITSDILVNILRNNSLPTPSKQADNLIMLMAERQPSIGHPAIIEEADHGLIGLPLLYNSDLPNAEAEILGFLNNELEKQEYVTKRMFRYALTFKGWQRYEELKQIGDTNSKKAFMAMEFAKPNTKEDYSFQNILLPNYFIPAAKQTGYELSNPLSSDPKAGNIHARLEVEIRNSRFIIAEISHHNNGAYWEAGFARGLGKPVIYMYNRLIGQAEKPPHFDVKSDHIIYWSGDKTPEGVADELKAVIRATLFGEAKMED